MAAGRGAVPALFRERPPPRPLPGPTGTRMTVALSVGRRPERTRSPSDPGFPVSVSRKREPGPGEARPPSQPQLSPEDRNPRPSDSGPGIYPRGRRRGSLPSAAGLGLGRKTRVPGGINTPDSGVRAASTRPPGPGVTRVPTLRPPRGSVSPTPPGHRSVRSPASGLPVRIPEPASRLWRLHVFPGDEAGGRPDVQAIADLSRINPGGDGNGAGGGSMFFQLLLGSHVPSAFRARSRGPAGFEADVPPRRRGPEPRAVYLFSPSRIIGGSRQVEGAGNGAADRRRARRREEATGPSPYRRGRGGCGDLPRERVSAGFRGVGPAVPIPPVLPVPLSPRASSGCFIWAGGRGTKRQVITGSPDLHQVSVGLIIARNRAAASPWFCPRPLPSGADWRSPAPPPAADWPPVTWPAGGGAGPRGGDHWPARAPGPAFAGPPGPRHCRPRRCPHTAPKSHTPPGPPPAVTPDPCPDTLGPPNSSPQIPHTPGTPIIGDPDPCPDTLGPHKPIPQTPHARGTPTSSDP
ncbi:basic proline-rich protein-like [Tachyglossus aculeatus]|uniref:basic proline-rich protein-like n=1 Tax=Tachyglossus aculeatus TaxID=9261 RepID=UPI0018F36D27|nr:basic proline-rich protein-like [Tachyglossus aculeatus]